MNCLYCQNKIDVNFCAPCQTAYKIDSYDGNEYIRFLSFMAGKYMIRYYPTYYDYKIVDMTEFNRYLSLIECLLYVNFHLQTPSFWIREKINLIPTDPLVLQKLETYITFK